MMFMEKLLCDKKKLSANTGNIDREPPIKALWENKKVAYYGLLLSYCQPVETQKVTSSAFL